MEGMERFSYYGFRAILTLYFVSLNLRESSAAAGFMFTSALAYAAPLVGAWLSDELWGRYATIMRFGGVYAVGLWVLVAAAAVASLPWTIVALVFVGLGTGGIKPCVSTFGADQIDNAIGDASEATRRYFAVFYASINLGSVFSYLLVPAMRAIFGYAAAFAVPAVLLAAALAVFIGGRRKYTMLPPREGGVGVRDCAGHVLRHPGPELPPHLLDGPPRVLLRSFENRVHDAAQAADVAIHSSRREDGQAPRLSTLALRPRPHARTERESAPARGLVDARDGRESPVNRERDAHALSPDDAQHRAHVLRRLVRGGCRR